VQCKRDTTVRHCLLYGRQQTIHTRYILPSTKRRDDDFGRICLSVRLSVYVCMYVCLLVLSKDLTGKVHFVCITRILFRPYGWSSYKIVIESGSRSQEQKTREMLMLSRHPELSESVTAVAVTASPIQPFRVTACVQLFASCSGWILAVAELRAHCDVHRPNDSVRWWLWWWAEPKTCLCIASAFDWKIDWLSKA